MLIEADSELKRVYDSLTAAYTTLLGAPDDADVQTYAVLAKKVMGGKLNEHAARAAMDAFQQEALRLPDPKVNDQYVPDRAAYGQWRQETKGFRLLGPRRVPSAILFQNTVDPVVKGRMFPAGVDFFAAGPLVSEAGKRALRQTVASAEIRDGVLAATTDPLPKSLHGKGLGLLRLLQKPLPASAPAPLRTPTWHDKQLWTSLGAWAEQRHTWALHTKLTVHYKGITREPPGYVSPYPEFFKQLARLARETVACLATVGTDEPDAKAIGQDLLACVRLFKRINKDRGSVREEDAHKLEQFSEFVERYVASRAKGSLPESEAEVDKLLEEIAKLAQRWIGGEAPDRTDHELMRLFLQPQGGAKGLLPKFAELCDALAAIAHKELEGQPLDQKDALVIKNYGRSLARFHFYGGNSWLNPRDDFPLVTPLFVSPVAGETLYAGLARPEALYVIIEVDGRPVLHRGGVLSYREFRRTTAMPLDDTTWQEDVKGGSVPPPPPFTRSFRKTTGED